MYSFARLAETDAAFARRAASLPWVVDGLTYTESMELRGLLDLASNDSERAKARLEELNERFG